MLHRAVRPPSVRGDQWLISPCIRGTDPTHLPPELFIIHTQTVAHTELCLAAGKCPELRDKLKAYLSVRNGFWTLLSACTSLPPFDNSHLLLLLCAVQMTKRGNGLWKIIINAAGLLTRKKHFLLCSQAKEHPFKPCTNHCALFTLQAHLYYCLDF